MKCPRKQYFSLISDFILTPLSEASVMLPFAFNICFLKSSGGTHPQWDLNRMWDEHRLLPKQVSMWPDKALKSTELHWFLCLKGHSKHTWGHTTAWRYSCNFIPWQCPEETSCRQMFLDMFCESGTLKEEKETALQQLHRLNYLCESQVNLMYFFLLTSEISG